MIPLTGYETNNLAQVHWSYCLLPLWLGAIMRNLHELTNYYTAFSS